MQTAGIAFRFNRPLRSIHFDPLLNVACFENASQTIECWLEIVTRFGA
jgi:hypothetical protein